MSSATLGFLSLIPIAFLLIAQALKFSFFQTLASVIPISDSNLWASCASALAAGHDSYNLAWCARRPLTVLLEAPLFALAPKSLGAAVVLQLLAVCLAFWWFLVGVNRSIAIRRWVLLAVYLLAVFPVFWYGTYLGPEGVALALSFVSAGGVLRYAAGGRLTWGLLGVASAIVVLEIRPGNFVLTVTLVVGLLVGMRRAGMRWLVVVAVAVGLLTLLVLPARLLSLAGWPSAGHASNFWSTAYSAATPEQDTWITAYDTYGPPLGCPLTSNWGPDPCLQLETEQFGQTLRDAAIQTALAHPTAVPLQMITNVNALVRDGFLNVAWGNPFSPGLPGLPGANLVDTIGAAGALFASAMWLLSVVLAVALIVRIVQSGPRRNPFDGFGSSREGRAQITGLWLGLVTILGVFVSFALVGHDEPQRHLVQSIPFLVLGIAAVVGQAAPPAVSQETSGPHWALLAVWVLVGLTIVTAMIEGRRATESIMLTGDCGGSAERAGRYSIIATAPVGTQTLVPSPSDWRRGSSHDVHVAFANRSWLGQMLPNLPDGQVLDLRSESTGEILPVFLSDESGALSTVDSGWCLRTPSRFGVMVVHDLVPRP